MDDDKVSVHFKIKREYKEILFKEAKRRGISVSALISLYCEELLNFELLRELKPKDFKDD